MGQSAHPFFDLHTHGFVRAATCTPCVRPADVSGNAKSIVQIARDAHEAAANGSDHAARRAPFAEPIWQVTLDSLTHGHAGVPRTQRGQFVGIGKACGRRGGIEGRR